MIQLAYDVVIPEPGTIYNDDFADHQHRIREIIYAA